jgi:hypothetical protein
MTMAEHEVATRGAVKRATRRAVHDNKTHLTVPIPGGYVSLELPPPDRLAFYGGLTVAAAFGAITWPMAIVTGLGHALADDHSNRTLEAVGEVLDAV